VSLQFNVSQLLKSDIGQTRNYEFASGESFDLDDALATDIHGQVRFILTNFGILARGRASATLHLTCARCLEPFAAPTEVTFEEEYQPSIDIATGLPASVPRSDTAFAISQNHTIDLSEALRQDLLLTVELIPVCSSGCQGLCPTCGVNRNFENCHCHVPVDSSPFAVLQILLTEAEREN
jgi:uncharacterized protein